MLLDRFLAGGGGSFTFSKASYEKYYNEVLGSNNPILPGTTIPVSRQYFNLTTMVSMLFVYLSRVLLILTLLLMMQLGMHLPWNCKIHHHLAWNSMMRMRCKLVAYLSRTFD